MLDSVFQGLQARKVRVYFGGVVLVPGVHGYTRVGKVRDGQRVNVHVSQRFFNYYREKAIKGARPSRAGALIHEFTHAFADTDDVGFSYEAGLCKALAATESALINAQNYTLFVDDALG